MPYQESALSLRRNPHFIGQVNSIVLDINLPSPLYNRTDTLVLIKL